jgi:hypothetical protein
MATDPNWDPVDEEIARLLEEDPDLAGELAEFDRAYEAGEVELIPDDEVRRRLEARGLRLAPPPLTPTPLEARLEPPGPRRARPPG